MAAIGFVVSSRSRFVYLLTANSCNLLHCVLSKFKQPGEHAMFTGQHFFFIWCEQPVGALHFS